VPSRERVKAQPEASEARRTCRWAGEVETRIRRRMGNKRSFISEEWF
jgi:hypothetical protein